MVSVGRAQSVNLRGVRTVNPSGNQEINYAGAQSSRATSWIFGGIYIYGTALADGAGILAPNRITVVDQANASGAEYLDAFAVVHRVSSSQGYRNTIHADLGVGANAAGVSLDYTPVLGSAYATGNQGGDGTYTTNPEDGYVAVLFGANFHPRLASGATYWSSIIGVEINVEIEDGASAFSKLGLLVARGGNDNPSDSGFDAAIVVSNKPTADVPWSHGLVFGGIRGRWPFDATSRMVGAEKRIWPTGGGESTITAGWGIDWTQVTFAEAAIATPGFEVTPTGGIVATLPSSNPSVVGALWNDNGTVKVSAG